MRFRPGRGARARGASLIEAMVAVAIMGILLAIAAPSYQRAVEQSRLDLAATNLRALWAAERCYFLENRTYTANLADLAALGVLDAALLSADASYGYAITSADGTSFGASATRTGSTRYAGSISIDQTGVVSGTVGDAGATLRPGFQ